MRYKCQVSKTRDKRYKYNKSAVSAPISSLTSATTGLDDSFDDKESRACSLSAPWEIKMTNSFRGTFELRSRHRVLLTVAFTCLSIWLFIDTMKLGLLASSRQLSLTRSS